MGSLFLFLSGRGNLHGGEHGGSFRECIELRPNEHFAKVEQQWKANSYLGRRLEFWTDFGRRTAIEGEIGRGKGKQYHEYFAPAGESIHGLVFSDGNRLIGIEAIPIYT